MPMGFQERLTYQARGHEATEGSALSDVLVGTAKGMLDCLACGLGFSDVLVDFGQLAAREAPPLIDGDAVRGQERLLLGECEPGVPQEQDDAHQRNRSFGVAPLPPDPLGCGKQAKLLPVTHS